MDKQKFKTDLASVAILVDEPLSKYTYTKTGGNADVVAFPKNKLEVQQVLDYCLINDIPWQVIGNASNLIIRDGGIRGCVIILSEMSQVSIENTEIIAEAGAKLVDVVKQAAQKNLTGLEFACGIPGSIGGAVYMNAGAYDGQISDVFTSCEVLTAEGKIMTISHAEMDFGYRHTSVQATGAIILSVTITCATGDATDIQKRIAELTTLRELKQPLEYPSCGSVFKRPVGHFTGKLIQDAGLQGLIHGGAQISEKHAGFIVNIDHATATDYLELIEHIKHVIYEKFAVRLETEVKVIGED